MPLKELLKIMIRRIVSNDMWAGDFASWKEAQQHSTGYDSDSIFKKVEAATLKVKNGEAVYERDSVIFDEMQYSWPMVSALLYVASLNNNHLNVLDFGGSLGTSYFQNRKFTSHLNLKWNIIEQEGFVKTGIEKIADGRLNFFYSIDECIEKNGPPDFLLLAGLLPYIEKPYELLDKLLSYNIPYLFIDNNYFNYEDRDRITVQTVRPEIYTASYPAWFLNYASVKQLISQRYNIISEHHDQNSLVLDGRRINYRGLFASMARIPA
ncbi:MAG: methyltransferase, TIGR04325 family [Pseudobacter sp.]|uniref:methyltransferase, TIGR04325 family n=1 Tax=Pseudobacter sp. TaxID=2045420 RepID=UPI003F7F7B76